MEVTVLGDNDTIAAIATTSGLSALSIVRVSGKNTISILENCFKSKTFSQKESHKLFYGLIKNPETEEPVDEVLVGYFTQGHGFTGEEAVDVICHGGYQMANQVLDTFLSLGARLARPGEFSYRAVMNNRIDLTQAEGVLDLIHANSPQAAKLALKNLRGGLSRELENLEKETTYLLANLEASIDFTTEDIQPVNSKEMGWRAQKVLTTIQNLLETFTQTQFVKQGLKIALVGSPNAGKSSLLNAILGVDRSIVTDIPGTTRDTVEAEIIFEQNRIVFVDTAGLRTSQDPIEQQGVERSHTEMQSANLVFYVVDSSIGLKNEDVEMLKQISSKRTVLCFNKSDLKEQNHAKACEAFGLSGITIINTCAIRSDGLEELKKYLKTNLPKHNFSESTAVISSLRQKEIFVRIYDSLTKTVKLLENEYSPEFVSFELRDALKGIHEIQGKELSDEILDTVFKEFCIGK